MWLNGKKVDILAVLRAAEKPANRFGRVEKVQRIMREVALELDADGLLDYVDHEDMPLAQRILEDIIEQGVAE